jgi:hypothetical protein
MIYEPSYPPSGPMHRDVKANLSRGPISLLILARVLVKLLRTGPMLRANQLQRNQNGGSR